MSEYMFGIISKNLNESQIEKLDNICKEEGGWGFTWYRDPGTRRSYGWFSGPNLGAPFDRDLRERVMERVSPIIGD
mgnify:FL=1